MAKRCSHREHIRPVAPVADGCQKCLELGEPWLHLRLCTQCGHVGCCDNSKNRHATQHFHDTRHPVVRSFEPGATWLYCYVDELFMDTVALEQDSSQ